MYKGQHKSNAPYFSLLNWVQDRVSCLTQWMTTLFSKNRSSVLQSVMHVQHTSSAEQQMPWAYVLGGEWRMNFLPRKAPVQKRFTDISKARTVRMP